MKIYSEYKSYQEYVDIQTETNKEKIEVVWVIEEEVIQLSNYIVDKYSDEIHYVMCHGARNGTEVKYFTESLPDNWIVEGNDISDTANAYGLHQWDMQYCYEGWKQKFTIQYTNSFDHVYDPQKTINSFMKQCATGGSVFIQWTENLNNEPIASDPLSISLLELSEMCYDYASKVNLMNPGMNRTVRYKDTNEILRQLKIYYLELKM